MAKTPLKDFEVTLQRPAPKPDVTLPIRALSSDAADQLAHRIAKHRGWKGAKIKKTEEKKQ